MEKSNIQDTHIFNEDIARDVMSDYEKRREARRAYESVWKLNMNYIVGNQYSYITSGGDIDNYEKKYYWQSREVYNHIAPVLETRLSKLSNVNVALSVRPASNDREDIESSKFSDKIIQATWQDNKVSALISKANSWSEITGTAFYKIIWDNNRGKLLGKNREGNNVYEGDLCISVCSPYEIFPDELSAGSIEECKSIIHAKAYSVDDIKLMYNVELKGGRVEVMKLDVASSIGNMSSSQSFPSMSSTEQDDYVMVIERYTRPTTTYPDGRLEIVAGGVTLYAGDIPYRDINNKVDLPFIRQACLDLSGNFFGNTIVERIIPVQRAYNALKNRKHEYINRIAGGILAVEDGSIDIDNLEEEGLPPGKIITYRQGSAPPIAVELGRVPPDFTREENALLAELTMISGVSDLMRYTQIPKNMTSGVAISLLIEQDDSKLLVTANNVREAIKEIGIKILCAYKLHASATRLIKISGENGDVELKYWKGSDITSCDVVFDTENEVINSPSSRKNMVYELLKIGLLHDERGHISDTNKLKILEMLGLGNWESIKSNEQLHFTKAMRENDMLINEKVNIDDYDNHNIHINEHTRFIISNKNLEDRASTHISEHIKLHKAAIMMEKLENMEAVNG